MGQFIDLRKYNIKTEEDAMEFLELFVAKAPQIVSFLKNQRLKNISLKNRLDHANRQVPAAETEVTDKDASVLHRLTGQHKTKAPNAAQSRIEQMKNVQAPVAPAAPATPAAEEIDDLPPAPAGPGEIGQLNVPTVNPQAPSETPAPELTPPAQPQAEAVTSDDAAGSEEAAAEAAGSKSELPLDDGVQSEIAADENDDLEEEGEELSEAERAAFEAPSTLPTEADMTAVGTKVARKTNNRKSRNKKNKKK